MQLLYCVCFSKEEKAAQDWQRAHDYTFSSATLNSFEVQSCCEVCTPLGAVGRLVPPVIRTDFPDLPNHNYI